MTPKQIELVRRRTQQALSPETAQHAGMHFEDLKAFVCTGMPQPSVASLENLARHFNLQDQIR